MEKERELLLKWITKVCIADNVQWLTEKSFEIEKSENPIFLFSAFAKVSRIIEKIPLEIGNEDQEAAQQIRSNWFPSNLNAEQAARAYLLLSFTHDDAQNYVETISKLFTAADLNEQIALYLALPLLPHQEDFLPIAYEGTRSNITAVFDAISLENPFPYDYFPDETYNRLVLKSAFMERPFTKMVGLKERKSPALANLLLDLVSERWAAGRKVDPLIWKLIVPGLYEDKYDEVLKSSDY